jgi:hypothetical protein
MPYLLKTPLDNWELSAVTFRTHLGHRENVTGLAIGLIRKGAAAERASAGDDPFEIECAEIAEPWAIGHVIQGCYIEEYHQWEKAIKQYFSGQRKLNGLTDDFDWRAGKKSLVECATDALSFFDTAVDQAVTSAIDTVRETVNWLKHDPLSNHVEEGDYAVAIKAFIAFWDSVIETETRNIG